MNKIIIYKSKTGFTKRYADWIGEVLKCDVVNYIDFPFETLEKYEYIIYGNRIHAGKVDGLKKIKQMIDKKPMIQLVAFSTGGTPNEATEIVDKIWSDSLSENELTTIPHFYMQAGLNYEKMKFSDRLIMKTLSEIMNKKKNKTEEEAGCENAIASSYDISSIKYIEPLIKYFENIERI